MFFPSGDVKVANIDNNSGFKFKSPLIPKVAEKPNSSKISNVGSLLKMFEKKVICAPEVLTNWRPGLRTGRGFETIED